MSADDSVQGGGPSPHDCSKSHLSPITNVAFNVILYFGLLAVSPIILLLLALVYLVPALDQLLHHDREYFDGNSALQLNQIEGVAIHLCLMFKERVDPQNIVDKFEEIYVKAKDNRYNMRRFRQRAVRRNWLWPYWEEVPDDAFDRSYHMIVDEETYDKVAIEKKISHIQSEVHLDLTKPTWQLYVFKNCTDDLGQPCTIAMIKGHHCMFDGYTGLRLFLHGSEPKKDPNELEPSTANAARKQRAKKQKKITVWNVIPYWVKSFQKLLLMQNDPTSIFKSPTNLGPMSSRNCTWHTIAGVDVDDIKKFAKGPYGGGGTVNDVLLTALSNALRRYATLSGEKVPSEITAGMWVSKTPLRNVYKSFDEDPLVWGNKGLGCVYLKIPVVDEALTWDAPLLTKGEEQVEKTIADMQERLSDPALMLEANLAVQLMSLFGLVPRVLCKPLWKALSNKITVSMSNMPGPAFPVEWCSTPLQSLVFFVPPQNKVSFFVSLITYSGGVTLGLNSDASIIKADALRTVTQNLFPEELKKLVNSGK